MPDPSGYDDYLAPRFLLTGEDGTSMSDVIDDITAMSYEDVAHGMDRVTFNVRNPDLKYANDARFLHGFRFRLKFGYFSSFTTERLVIVTGAAPTYPNGMPMITLTSYDQGRDLAMGTRPRNWGSITSSQIAQQIARDFGMNSDTDDSADGRRQSRVQPANMSPFEYLNRLSEHLGWDFYVDANTVHFHRMRTGAQAVAEYTYFKDGRGVMKDFQPSVKAARPPATRHANTDAAGRAASSAQTGQNASDARSNTNTAQYVMDVFVENGRGGRTRRLAEPVVHHTPETDPRRQADHARAHQTRLEMAAVKASASLIGQPLLKSRDVIRVDVQEQRYSGLWRIDKAVHTIDAQGGYNTNLELSRRGLNTGPRTNRSPTNQTNNNTSTANSGQIEINTQVVSGRSVAAARATPATPRRAR